MLRERGSFNYKNNEKLLKKLKTFNKINNNFNPRTALLKNISMISKLFSSFFIHFQLLFKIFPSK